MWKKLLTTNSKHSLFQPSWGPFAVTSSFLFLRPLYRWLCPDISQIPSLLFVPLFLVCELSVAVYPVWRLHSTGCEQRKRHNWNVLVLSTLKEWSRAGSTTHTHVHTHADTCDHAWHISTNTFRLSFASKSSDEGKGSFLKRHLYMILPETRVLESSSARWPNFNEQI